ncbi:MAG: cell division protein ZapA [Arcicella sp.]|jgi:cell division protein ZapA|nr:cell division protein ZapA [Arcicella sp.]
MDKKLTCNVIVGTEGFSLTAPNEKEEEIVRKAAKLINEKMLHYQQKNGIKSTQRLLALSALDFVMSNLKFDNQHNELEASVLDKVVALENVIDNLITE